MALKPTDKNWKNNNRDINGLYLLAVYGIAAVDAYVGAHLFDFDISFIVRIIRFYILF